VKTSFKSKSAANPPDFRKLQFAKALISLKLKFWRLGFKHNLIRSLTFSHSLGQKQKSVNASAISALPLTKDELLQIADSAPLASSAGVGGRLRWLGRVLAFRTF
jgi:hypothetical protein